MRRQIFLLMLAASAFGCEIQLEDRSPVYFWQFTVSDSATGAPITTASVHLLEENEHRALHWFPVLLAGRDQGDSSIYVPEYRIDDVDCTPILDTALVLTLEISDSSGRYQPATHRSVWQMQCTTDPWLSHDPLPYPSEAPFEVRLQPIGD